MRATQAQIDYATFLLNELGYDLDAYDFDDMTKEQVNKLIGELKAELEG